MSRLSNPDAPSSHLPKVVAAAALGALIGTRSRTAGAVVLGGLTWLATRRSRVEPKSETLPRAVETVPLTEGLAEEVFPASSPFIDSEPPAADWEELRTALAPPPSLWPPSPPVEVPFTDLVPPRPPSSPLLQSAPVFVEFPEDAPPPVVPRAAKAILPDTISIPNTPDPPPGLLAATDTSPQPSAQKTFPPVAGSKADGENAAKKVSQEPFGRPYVPPAPPKSKGFLGWLRSE